ncbi:AGE family epimerase/isomerase [Eggerthella guodeyinii]|uniref:AGE family epimerase/isomerase n=1 Tax=Eggerthella guodeyinii TaxID=2690837 RepID=A0A6N7RP01_9ACTN|nr:AGE family epimerase/isomerase [Eggerthella guodeyinii]MRX82976.1 N-acylglucosamine 2-epimerase [Eggerthella guodeyinii]QOS67288.1 AGE family epimerase/isomerase [Eggerthella guodeyinii]
MTADTTAQLIEARDWLRQELDACVAFWLEHGMDEENGGVYTCLDRTGQIYSTDKSVWMQGRCAWTFSHLCRLYGEKPEWMAAAKSCLDFLEDHCINREAGDRLYFTVTAEGRPLRQRRYCFSEGFYAIANAEYYGLTGEDAYLERARRAYRMIYDLNNGLIEDPTGLGPKTIPETRSGRALGDPMIFLNIIGIMRRVDPANTEEYNRHAKECTDRIVNEHYRPELGCTLESVNLDGEPELWYTAGRVVNPGHDIECSWFMMDEANFRGDEELHRSAEQIFRLAIEAGWDEEYGGLLYFIDAKGLPTEAYEHDMKLWWPHNEIMIAASKAYRDTGDEYYLDWLLKTMDYCKQHFADPEYGEWYGYLRRDGLPTMPPTKGSTFKGPFHVPRALSMTERVLTELIGD